MRDDDRERRLRRDADEGVREVRGDRRLRDHPEDAAVERELDQHAGGRRDRLRHRAQKRARTPVQQQAGGEERRS